MMLNDKEKLHINNLLKMIRRSKFDDLQGLEALALAGAYHWLESVLVEQTIAPPPPAVKPNPPPIPVPLMPIEETPVFDETLAGKPKRKPKKSK